MPAKTAHASRLILVGSVMFEVWCSGPSLQRPAICGATPLSLEGGHAEQRLELPIGGPAS